MKLSKTRARSWRLVALLSALAMIAAACGGDDDDNGDDTDTTDEAEADDGEEDDAAEDDGAEDDGEEDDAADDEMDEGDDGGEATGLLAELQEAGSITVGVANEVPYGFVGDDGEPTGIGPDVARAVLEELGIEEMDAQVVEFGELIGGLQAGQFDMITAGMYINQERAEQVLFSDPDYCVPESFAVAEGNPLGLTDYQSVVDTPEATIAVATGTVEVGYAEDAGIPDEQIEVFGDIEGMYRALEAGEVDAVTGTYATVSTQADAREGIEALDGFFPVDAEGNEVLPCGGHAFRQENQEFRDAFNEVLNEFREDGTTMEIITSYEEFTEQDVELANTLTVEDFLE